MSVDPSTPLVTDIVLQADLRLVWRLSLCSTILPLIPALHTHSARCSAKTGRLPCHGVMRDPSHVTCPRRDGRNS